MKPLNTIAFKKYPWAGVRMCMHFSNIYKKNLNMQNVDVKHIGPYG